MKSFHPFPPPFMQWGGGRDRGQGPWDAEQGRAAGWPLKLASRGATRRLAGRQGPTGLSSPSGHLHLAKRPLASLQGPFFGAAFGGHLTNLPFASLQGAASAGAALPTRKARLMKAVARGRVMALPWVEGAGLDRGASPTPSLCAVPRAQANELFVMFRTGWLSHGRHRPQH